MSPRTLLCVIPVVTCVALYACGDDAKSNPVSATSDAALTDVGVGKTDSSSDGSSALDAGADGVSDAADACACEAGAVCSNGVCQDVAGSLGGARWELSCTGAPNGSNVCSTGAAFQKTVTLSGASGKAYDVTLRFRGLVEQKTYTATTDAGAAVGAQPDGGINPALFVAGGTPASDGFNVYRLEVDSPQQTYHLNAGASAIYHCFEIDYLVTVRVNAGAQVKLTADPLDGAIIANKGQSGSPIVVANVPPAPAPYNGQFVQMDVVAVTAAN